MRNVLAIGAFERDNFGDFLFYEVLRRALPDDNVIPSSFIAGDMRSKYGFMTVPYDFALRGERFDAVWVVGGQVGGVTVPSALEMSLGGHVDPNLHINKQSLYKKLLVLYGANDNNLRAYIPDLSAYTLNAQTPMIIHSVGLTHIFADTTKNKALLQQARRVVVRDTDSVKTCKSQGVSAVLSPDVVHSLSKFYQPKKTSIREGILFQANEALIGQYGEVKIARILKQLHQESGQQISLVAAGTAYGHDSLAQYQKIVDLLAKEGVDVEIVDTRKPLEIVDHIASAAMMVGTSLHVRIIAETYAVPRISLTNEKTARYASEWDPDWPLNVAPEDLVQEVKNINESPVAVQKKQSLSNLAYQHLQDSIQALGIASARSDKKKLNADTLLLEWSAQRQKELLQGAVQEVLHTQSLHGDIERLMRSETLLKEQKRQLERSVAGIRNSVSYRIGRKMTAPYRLFRRIIKR